MGSSERSRCSDQPPADVLPTDVDDADATGGMTFWVVSDLNLDELQQFAQMLGAE